MQRGIKRRTDCTKELTNLMGIAASSCLGPRSVHSWDFLYSFGLPLSQSQVGCNECWTGSPVMLPTKRNPPFLSGPPRC